jgi:NAD(P)-dependent dehydrogenase (short-subunit alcohol dehydrogenase family)
MGRAYSTAKFAVKRFTEALIEDLRVHAPHVRVAVVPPGHVGTDIIVSTFRARGLPDPEHMSDDLLAEVIRAGLLAEGASADDLRQLLRTSGTRRRSARPRRRRSSSMGCGPGTGGSLPVTTPR